MKYFTTKNILWSFLLYFFVTSANAQTPKLDSLQSVLSRTTVDTTRVNLLVQSSRHQSTFEKRIASANEALVLAQKINYGAGQAIAAEQLGSQYRAHGNYPLALHYAFSSLAIREQINDTTGMSRGYFIAGLVYEEMGDIKNALSHLQKAIKYSSPDNTRIGAITNAGIAGIHFKLNKMDSALHYYQKSYEYFNLDRDKFAYCAALDGLGDLQFEKGNYELAIGYYRQALQNAAEYNDKTGYMTTYHRMATLFKAMAERDSTIKYGKLTLQYASDLNNYAQVNKTATMLSKIYQDENPRTSLSYLQTAKAATDSILNLQTSGQIQSLVLGQAERERAGAAKKQSDLEQNRQNIQLTFIAFTIVTFVIVFLLLSYRFITNSRLIEFLNGISFLLIFEFLYLLLHPFLEKVTHHSPASMLLALVCIAAVLVPLHHKMEHWTSARLVEKNKAVRLAAAKRTIEQLDKKPEMA